MRALYRELEHAVSAALSDATGPYNFGLRFNKWVSFRQEGPDGTFDKNQYQSIVDDFGRWANRQKAGLRQALDRLEAYAKTAGQRKELAIQFQAVVTSPLVIGIGGAHPSEVGLTFHWTLGVPYIPATSIKGLCRFAFEVEEINRFSSEDELRDQREILRSLWTGKEILDEEKRPRQEPLLNGEQTNPHWPATVARFGSQDAMGAVRFLDALPLPDGLALQLDIMNPHYPEYYTQEGGPGPTECQNPVPILFWAVAPGSRFSFALVARENHRDQIEGACACLQMGLEAYGIGAKTAVGYGRLRHVEASEKKWGGPYDRQRAEQEEAERIRVEQAARDKRGQELQRRVESDCQRVRTFKGAQDKSGLEAILKSYDSWHLMPVERELVAQQLEQALPKDLRKGKLWDVLRQWRKTWAGSNGSS